jgi:ATP-dependent helicase/nuclease subunit B
LQLFVYLRAALEKVGVGAFPAGAFYYHIDNPYIDEKDIRTDLKKGISLNEAIEKNIKKRLRLHGYANDDKDKLYIYDRRYKDGGTGTSDVIHVELTGDGAYHKGAGRAKVLSAEDMHAVMQYAYKKACDAVGEILDGTIAIKPYMMSKKTACTYCAYKDVCRFDKGSHTYNDLKDIAKIDEARAIEIMKEAVYGIH